MEQEIPQNLKELTPHQYWLLEHQITAFWHGFGISNGLHVPEEMTEIRKFRDSPRRFVFVKPMFMRQQLDDYNKWLESYKENWNGKNDDWDMKLFSKGWGDFIEDEKTTHPESRLPILKMIGLLQDHKAEQLREVV